MNDTIIYSWIDDLGYHQYYCDINHNIDVLPIKNFNHNITNNERIYSWSDNLGYHQYYVDIN